ncbi:hypothetical protein QPR87_20765, partial [Paracoccus sp. SSJ]|nr:hypothetical protein [Paracoccus sp. SSJ]
MALKRGSLENSGKQWLGLRHKSGDVWVVFFPLLFDIAVYLKGYVGGLVVFRLGSLYIGSLGQPMMRVSAS